MDRQIQRICYTIDVFSEAAVSYKQGRKIDHALRPIPANQYNGSPLPFAVNAHFLNSGWFMFINQFNPPFYFPPLLRGELKGGFERNNQHLED